MPNPLELDSNAGAPGDRGAEPGEESLIVVTTRPGRGSVALFPPILLVMLGTAFLAYRVATPDWQGLLALLDRPESSPSTVVSGVSKAGSLAAKPEETKGATPAVATNALETPRVAAQEFVGPPKPQFPLAKAAPDTEQDIRREAEQNRERLAELEAIKRKEAEKLDQSADARQRADELDRLRNPKIPRLPPDLARQFARHQETIRKQMAQFEQFHRRQLARMAEMERQFWNQPRDFSVPPPPQPGLGFDLPPGMGNGAPQFRRFDGPNGMRGFLFHWGLSPDEGDKADRDEPPPPPQPRIFD
jgi:hypothetical protein